MGRKEFVQAFLKSIQDGDLTRAGSFLSNDFLLIWQVSEPINAEAWLEMNTNLRRAFPNLEYHFRVESVQSEGVVKISSELKAIHRGDLDLTAMNLGVIPASNRSFAPTREHSRLIVKDDKVISWVVKPAKGAGLRAILIQLGIQMPDMRLFAGY